MAVTKLIFALGGLRDVGYKMQFTMSCVTIICFSADRALNDTSARPYICTSPSPTLSMQQLYDVNSRKRRLKPGPH